MPKIWGTAKNDKYIVECSGQTTYIYSPKKELVTKLKGQSYAYSPLIAPNNTLWIKANTGHMLVYSLEDFSLIKKWKEAKTDSQDGNHALSWDGNNIVDVVLEKNNDPWFSLIRFFDVGTLEKREFRLNTTAFAISRYDDNRSYILLHSNYGHGEFLSLFNEEGLVETKRTDGLPGLHSIISLQSYGFTEELFKWSAFTYLPESQKMTMDEIKRFSLSEYYRNLTELVPPEELVSIGI